MPKCRRNSKNDDGDKTLNPSALWLSLACTLYPDPLEFQEILVRGSRFKVGSVETTDKVSILWRVGVF